MAKKNTVKPVAKPGTNPPTRHIKVEPIDKETQKIADITGQEPPEPIPIKINIKPESKEAKKISVPMNITKPSMSRTLLCLSIIDTRKGAKKVTFSDNGNAIDLHFEHGDKSVEMFGQGKEFTFLITAD